MCRILGYATAGTNLSLDAILGHRNTVAYRDMSEIHNDGWGCATIAEPDQAPGIEDGGAPSPETGTKLYKTTIAARRDPIFNAIANQPARGSIWHLRLASSDLPLILENQQPFFSNGYSFIHNGDISDSHGRNITANRQYPVNRSIYLSTGGRSDSAIFFAIILEYARSGYALDEAVAQAVRELRQTYPKSSYNCMIQTQDQLVALNAAGRERTSARVVEIYEQYGQGEKAADYRVMRYRALGEVENGHEDGHEDGLTAEAEVAVAETAEGCAEIALNGLDADGTAAVEATPAGRRAARGTGGVVVASSGFDQPESEGWRDLGNDQMIVASNRTGEWYIRSI